MNLKQLVSRSTLPLVVVFAGCGYQSQTAEIEGVAPLTTLCQVSSDHQSTVLIPAAIEATSDGSSPIQLVSYDDLPASTEIQRLPPTDFERTDQLAQAELGDSNQPNKLTVAAEDQLDDVGNGSTWNYAVQQTAVPAEQRASLPAIDSSPVGTDEPTLLADHGELPSPLSGEYNFEVPMEAVQAAVPSGITAAERASLRIPASVSQRGNRMLADAMSLANRGAYFAANREFLRTFRTITQSLDSQLGRQFHTRALAAGLRALEEADDFALATRDHIEDDVHLDIYINGHRTPVLKGTDLSNMTPLIAIQKYYEYAREQLTLAGGHFPLSSQVLFAMGRAENFIGREKGRQAGAPRALAFFHASLATDPRNHRASNELGVMLAKRGRLAEAAKVIQHGVSVRPTPTSLNNLAKLFEEMGDPRSTELRNQSTRIAATQPATSMNQPVVWLSPQQFATTATDNVKPPMPAPVAQQMRPMPRQAVRPRPTAAKRQVRRPPATRSSWW